MRKEVLVQLIVDCQKKKDLLFLSKKFIEDFAKEQCRLNKKIRTELEKEEFQKSKIYKQLIKDIREKARKPYGVFQVSSLLKKRRELLEHTTINDKEAIQTILESHLSTKERIPYYPQFHDLIKTKKTIVDLACGMNPIALLELNPKLKITASDVSEDDCHQLNTFFTNNKIKAQAIRLNLLKDYEKLKELTKNTDFTLLLKALDTLESQKKYITYKILENIQSKLIIVSFPIKSVSNKDMKRDTDHIHWFEKMCPRLNLTYTITKFPNEIFYLLKHN